jgi:hypothetical protein
MPVERLGWCPPAEGLAWHGVECVRDRFDLVGRPARQVGAFGDVLAKQPIGRSYVCQAAPTRSFSWTVVSIRR